MKLLAHASGFKYPFRNIEEEMRCGRESAIGGDPECTWTPSNPDFDAYGKTSGGSNPVASVAELIDLIRKQPVGSIDELRIIGHSSETIFALAGTVLIRDPKYVCKFDVTSARIEDSSEFQKNVPTLHQLRGRFTDKGEITLAGCGNGAPGSALLELVSKAFLVAVNGFKRPIQYAIDFGHPGTVARNHRSDILRLPGWVLNWRGRAMYSPATMAIENLFPGDTGIRAAATGNAWDLVPDARSEVGINILRAANRTKMAKLWGANIAADELGWRMLSAFASADVHLFAGVGADPQLRGLRYELVQGKNTLIVGIPWAQNTSFATIDKRIAELAQIVELVRLKRPGTVIMT